MYDDEAPNGERLAHDTSKLNLHYFLKVIVSVTFMTSLTWYSGGPIFGWAWGCSPISPRLNPALLVNDIFRLISVFQMVLIKLAIVSFLFQMLVYEFCSLIALFQKHFIEFMTLIGFIKGLVDELFLTPTSLFPFRTIVR